MRVRLTFYPKNERRSIPINYNTEVSRYIYDLLCPDDPIVKGERTRIYYTFSNLQFSSAEHADGLFHLPDAPLELLLSILSTTQAEEHIRSRLTRRPPFTFSRTGLNLELLSIEEVPEKLLSNRSSRFRMLSPLFTPAFLGSSVQKKVDFREQSFSDYLGEILIAKYRLVHNKEPEDTEFKVELDESYIERRQGRISKLVTLFEGETEEKKVKAVVAPFQATGNPDLIRLGYVAGFGEKNFLGFGCTEIIGPRSPFA